MFSNVLARYRSSLEKTYILMEKDKKNILFWVFSKEKGKEEVLSFDNLHYDEETGHQLIEWFKTQEKKGMPITKALEFLESESSALEQAVLGTRKQRRT